MFPEPKIKGPERSSILGPTTGEFECPKVGEERTAMAVAEWGQREIEQMDRL